MSRLSTRCLVLVVATLFACAFALLAIAALAHAPLAPAAAVSVCAVPAVAACVLWFLLAPLRADLAAILELVLAAAQGRAPDPEPVPRTAEAKALLERVALVRARSSELERLETEAQRAIEEAERVRIRFVAAMGHDLRGPLNSILGFADLLVMDDHDAVAASQRPSVELIRRSAQDLLMLLEQILTWAKLEAGQIVLDKQPVLLIDVLREAVREAEARSADRGLLLELAFEPGLPWVEVDHARFVQALLGLMDHATRASDPARVKLEVRVLAAEGERPRRVRIDLHDPELRVRAADHDSFFEAFRPSYAPSGRRVTGLGLGPALARALIRAHGGEVWFASRADTGTTFSAELPLAS